MLSLPRYLRIVRLSAWYDLIVSAGFATPWTFALIHQGLSLLAQQSVVVWSLVRLRDTQPVYGRYDALGRFLFAAWQLYAVAQGASWLILGFTAVELAFGLAQLLPLRNQLPRFQVDPIPNKP